jgi:hypothetical protein
MTRIIGYILGLVQTLTKASPETKKWAATIFAVFSALTLLSGVMVSVAAGLASLYFWFKILRTVTPAGGKGGGGFVAFTGNLLKFGAVLTAVTAAIPAFVDQLQDMKNNEPTGNLAQRMIRRFVEFNRDAAKRLPLGLGKIWEKEFGFLADQEWLVGGVKPKARTVKKVADSMDAFMAKVRKAMKLKGTQQFAGAIKEAQDALNQVLNQTKTDDAAAKQRAQSIIDAQAQIMDQVREGLMKMYDEKKTQNEAAFGTLFAGPISQSGAVMWRKQFGMQMSTPEMLRDFRAQLVQFRTYRKRIATLRRRGLSEDIIKDVQARGAEGIPIFKALMQATPRQIGEFNRMMKGRKKDIAAASQIDFTSQLNQYLKFGRMSALKIITGMESEEYAVQKRMNALAKRLFSGVAKVLATQQINLQYGVVIKKGAPPLNPPAKPTVPKGFLPPIGGLPKMPMLAPGMGGPLGTPIPGLRGPIGTRTNFAPGVQGPVGQRTPNVIHNHFNINGTFLTEEQMMNRALQYAAWKDKAKRR